MKLILSAIALAFASPALAQAPAPAHDAHAQHAQHAGHAQHADHAKHAQHNGASGHEGHADHDGCCKKDADGKMACCEKMKAQGKKMDCCQKHSDAAKAEHKH